jgi:hypothetical protein
MGGHGSVTCNDCGHSEDVTSFIHGSDAAPLAFNVKVAANFMQSKAVDQVGRTNIAKAWNANAEES